jgi:tellurite resistance protein TerC
MLAFNLFGLDLSDESFLFGVFGLVIFVFLLLDLGIFNKTAHKISTKSALYQSIFWVFISTVFGYLIYAFDSESGGANGAFEYFSAYLTEYALSVDNIFVILLILKYFKVKEEYFHKVLFWEFWGPYFSVVSSFLLGPSLFTNSIGFSTSSECS